MAGLSVAARIETLVGHTCATQLCQCTEQIIRTSNQYAPELTKVAERIDTVVVAVRKQIREMRVLLVVARPYIH